MKFFPFYVVLLGLYMGRANTIATENTTLVSQTRVEEFIVRGNEPFWSVTISRNGIIYSTPESPNRRYPYTAPISAAGRPPEVVRVYRLNGQPSGLLVIKKADSCSDTMSDIVYPYSATLILGNRVLDGCAQKR